MLYYLGYLTIDTAPVHCGKLPLKIPNLFMSKLFARCIADMRLRPSRVFTESVLDISSFRELKDDIAPFAASCTEFLSRVFTSQALGHMSAKAFKLALFTKLELMTGVAPEIRNPCGFWGTAGSLRIGSSR